MTMTTKPLSKLTRDGAAKYLAILAETLGTRMDSVRLEGYWLALSAPRHGITDESLAKATETLLSTCERMPPPVEIIKLAKRVSSAGIGGMYLPAAKVLEAQQTCLFHKQPGNANRPSSEHVYWCASCSLMERRSLPRQGHGSQKQLSAILDDSKALRTHVIKGNGK
jgi:hypothetical protein